MADVFISYKNEDREWAQKVDALIRSAGYTTCEAPPCRLASVTTTELTQSLGVQRQRS